MRTLKLIGKISGVTLCIIVACICVLILIYRNQIATIRSVRQIDEYPIYTMDYKGTYWFDEYVKSDAGSSDEEIISFLENKLSNGLIKNAEDGEKRNNAMCTCFVCRNENGDILYCRNLEQKYMCPSVVVTTDAGKYKTIGTSFLIETPEEASKLIKNIAMLGEPYTTADGMNEAGLAISLLSVPYAEMPVHEGAPKLSAEQVCRLILDEAGSVDEAVALFDTFNLDASPYESLSACHFLIADKSGRAIVVELHDGKVDVVESDKDYMMVTNYYLNDEISSGTGQARYKYVERVLEENDGVMTVDEALETLATVKDPYIHAEWSTVYNLTTGEMYIMPKGQIDHVHKVR